MTEQINDGGPAFPGTIDNGLNSGACGMTLRDYFAAAALQGLLAANLSGEPDRFAARAYVYANEMIKARNGQ